MCSVLLFFPDNFVNDASWLIPKKKVQGAKIFLDLFCGRIYGTMVLKNLALIRIREFLPVPLIYGSGSCFFHQWQDANKRRIFIPKFFCLSLLERRILLVFIENIQKEVAKAK
jgi:hypothetical protein